MPTPSVRVSAVVTNQAVQNRYRLLIIGARFPYIVLLLMVGSAEKMQTAGKLVLRGEIIRCAYREIAQCRPGFSSKVPRLPVPAEVEFNLRQRQRNLSTVPADF